jgi:aryl-alcohol dehydrogenase-like predicted oxidoreductase
MEFRPLGRTGTLVSTLCLGTMTFGHETEESEAHRMLDAYVDTGGNFIDTADVYQRGISEGMIGRWLDKSRRRDDLVIATKVRFPMDDDDPNKAGLSRRWIRRECDSSLSRLQTDYIDLYQAHCWDPATPLEETLSAFDELVTAGKIRYVGVSNFSGWQMQRATLLAESNGWAPVITLQPQYNLLAREIEWELVPLCLDEGIGILPWSPLGGGWLTGKYSRADRPTGSTRLGEDPERGVEAYDTRNTERTWRVVDAVRTVADGNGISMAQVAISWVTDQPGVASTILGARNLEQLRDNLGAVDFRLSDEEASSLTEVSEPGRPDYPYGYIHDMTEQRAL